MPIHIPALHQRKTDIPILIHHFCAKYAPDKNLQFDTGALNQLTHYRWPGNVRQLEHLVQRICLTSATNEITTEMLPQEYFEANKTDSAEQSPFLFQINDTTSFDSIIKDVEKNILINALDKSSGNQKNASKMLKMPYSTFRNKLEKHLII